MASFMDFQRITVALSSNLPYVARITLSRPELRNAFDERTIAELTHAFTEVGQAEQVRVVVLDAQGSAFCAGADLNWMKRMAGYTAAENRADALTLATMLNTIYTCPKPVVAQVQGDAYAGGLGLVAACDIVVAAEGVQFCLSEARLGLIPATIAPYVLRAMGEQAARRYFITAERFDAQQALKIGLAHEVSPAETLAASVAAIAQALAANSPNAVKECKQLVMDLAGRPIDAALMADTAERIARIRASAEGREGVGSFLEKRKPAWLAQ
jgi:methylglutaconyl-CoA hydratase